MQFARSLAATILLIAAASFPAQAQVQALNDRLRSRSGGQRVQRQFAREVFRMGQFASNHNIGVLAFNPTAAAGSPDYGILYASFGDAGAANDPRDFSRTLSEPHGAIIRIDPLPGDDSRGYGIPADNPFVGEAGVAPKIWAYGLRHAQQFSWDADGRMFMGDIGPNFVEEVNLGIPGANYGWRLSEGTFATGYGRAGRRTTWTGRCAAPGLEPVRGHRPRGVLRHAAGADGPRPRRGEPGRRGDDRTDGGRG